MVGGGRAGCGPLASPRGRQTTAPRGLLRPRRRQRRVCSGGGSGGRERGGGGKKGGAVTETAAAGDPAAARPLGSPVAEPPNSAPPPSLRPPHQPEPGPVLQRKAGLQHPPPSPTARTPVRSCD
ncbi:hypothetical protein R6Z07F_019793 [Ovis aries]